MKTVIDRSLSDDIVNAIVNLVVQNFRCLGRTGQNNNPVADYFATKPPAFAGGVDVREVVKFIVDTMREGTLA